MDLPLSILNVKVVLQNAVHHHWIILGPMKRIDEVRRDFLCNEVLPFVFKSS